MVDHQPTHVTTHLKFVKEHAVELAASLRQLAIDFDSMLQYPEVLGAYERGREEVQELKINAECFASSAGELSDAIQKTFNKREYPEVHHDHKKERKQ